MVVCKFFLQGTCKFGANCKFEHQINTDHSYTNNSSILVQNYANKPQTTTNVDTNALVKAVVTDMTAAEKGGQWLLSSYAPFKEKPAFPGFEDHSMEEVRYLFYESMKNGSIEQYKQNLQVMLQQAMMKIKALQNPSPEAINVLKIIYDTPPSSSLAGNQFNAASSSSVFVGGQTQQQPLIGNPPPNQSIFATQQSVFAPANTNTNSIFAQNSGNSMFTQQPQNQNKSIFGPQPTSNNSIFSGGTSSSIFGETQQTVFNRQQQSPFNQQSVFTPNASPQQNIFQQNQYPSPVATNQFVKSSQFNTPQSTSPFATQQNSMFTQNPNQFNTQVTTTGPQDKSSFQHTQSIFGNTVQQAQAQFGVAPLQTKPNEEFYSKLEDLTEEEIKWFQSDDLDIMKIPEKPPAYEMCFKVQ